MPASFINGNGLEIAAAAAAITSSALNVTTGSYLFVHASHYTPGVNISAVVDTVGNTFIKAGTTQGGDANQDSEIWYTPSPVVGTTSDFAIVRYTSISSTFRIVQFAQFSWGGVTSISYDVESTHVLDSGSAIATTLTTSVADSLLLGAWVAFDSAIALSTGTATKIVEQGAGAAADDFALGYLLADSVSAYGVSLIGPTGNRYSVVCKAFVGIGGGGTATPAAAMYTLTLTNAGQG